MLTLAYGISSTFWPIYAINEVNWRPAREFRCSYSINWQADFKFGPFSHH